MRCITKCHLSYFLFLFLLLFSASFFGKIESKENFRSTGVIKMTLSVPSIKKPSPSDYESKEKNVVKFYLTETIALQVTK